MGYSLSQFKGKILARNIIIPIALLNFWFWKILSLNYFIAFLLLILSCLLWYSYSDKKNRKYSVGLVSIFLFLSVLLIKNSSDLLLWNTTPQERLKLNDRHMVLADALGGIYKNRMGVYYYNVISPTLLKLKNNFFSNLNINLYFFSNHPRERSGIEEFNKYSPLVLPFFILGLYRLFIVKNKILLGYFVGAAFISSFITQTYSMGPILFFPFINVAVCIGLNYLLSVKIKST